MSQPFSPSHLIVSLLSPSPDVHTPAITTLQTHYDDLDDRSDAFRTLLDRYPAESVYALCTDLRAFIADASKSKDHKACVERAKWLVRCFHDILDSLCQPSTSSRPLLQAKHFLNATYRPTAPSSSSSNRSSSDSAEIRMSELVYELWNLMTTALAVIFRRTPKWAPSFSRDVMVDWMRDALIFGRQMVEHIGVFEVAALGGTADLGGTGGMQEVGRMTKTGKKLVKQAQVVLVDLVSWFRLTDVETLHQTFELVKFIVSRFTRSKPDLADAEFEQLKKALYEIDGFSRRESKKYQNRLSEDQLAELSELISPFDLPPLMDEADDVQFVGENHVTKHSTGAAQEGSWTHPVRHAQQHPAEAKKGERNAFDEMMRRAAGGKTSTSAPRSGPSSDAGAGASSDHPIDVDGFEEEDFLEELSAADLDGLEQRAQNLAKTQTGGRPASSSTTTPTSRSAPQPSIASMLNAGRATQSRSGQGLIPSSRLNMHVGPSANAMPRPSTSSSSSAHKSSSATTSASHASFKSSLMQQARMEHRHHIAVRDKRLEIGGVTRALPAASNLGTGLGAFQGQRRTVQPVESSGSSSDDSGEEGAPSGLSGLLKKQKSPKKLAKLNERSAANRPIKVMGNQYSDIVRQQEERRARQHAIKMRLKPDLTSLFRYILSWDPSHTGTDAPHPPRLAQEIGTFQKVPTTMPSVKKYEQIMLPLFLQELWAQFHKESTGPGSNRDPPVNVEVAGVAYEDDFVDLEVIVVPGPHMGMLERFHLNETDVVVLRSVAGPHNVPVLGPPGVAGGSGGVGRQVFGKIVAFKRKFREMSAKVRIMGGNNEGMGVKCRLMLTKHTSLSTALREFGALKGLPYYESRILADVMSARSATMPQLSSTIVQDAMSKYELNEPQARAVIGSLMVEGFALIQGPPGTGKTKTISGLVGKFLSERVSGISVNGSKPNKPKILVCAPSNAAIDEVCKRLMNGVPSASGGRITPNIVRIGIDSSVNVAVKDVAIDNLVESRVASDPSNKAGGGDYGRIQAELESVKKAIKEKADEMQRADSSGDTAAKKAREDEYHALMAQRTALGQQSSRAKDAARDATRHLDAARRAAKEAILADADVICATLSGAGQEILSPHTFETVIIDEAAQAIEASCLIPLKYGCRRCVMVGDPNQLPPTTFSTEAERCGYNESLFVRMVRRDASHVALLSIQYRMHPFISELPSKVFYHGRLHDGPDMAMKTTAVWHERPVFGPYRFFNVEGSEEKAGTSTRNPAEAIVAVELYRRLSTDFGDRVNLALRVGVITMYKEQVAEIRRRFIGAFGAGIIEQVDFNTVDGFQGQEKDIIILSCVRSGPALQTIGFLRDPRRMNVALTRAKSSLFVIGNAATLERSDERWRTIVGDARERGFLLDYKASTFAPPVEPPPSPAGKKVKQEPGAASSMTTAAAAAGSGVKRKMSKMNSGVSLSLQAQADQKPSKEVLDSAVPLKRARPASPTTLTHVKPSSARAGPSSPSPASTSSPSMESRRPGPAGAADSDDRSQERREEKRRRKEAKAAKAARKAAKAAALNGHVSTSTPSSSRSTTPEHAAARASHPTSSTSAVAPPHPARSDAHAKPTVPIKVKTIVPPRPEMNGALRPPTPPSSLPTRPPLPPLRPDQAASKSAQPPKKAEDLAFIKKKKKKLPNGK